MPNEFESTDVIQSGDFDIRSRNKDQGEIQASETFVVTSSGMRPLGSDGQTFGVAKRDLYDLRVEKIRLRDEAWEAATVRLNEIKSGLQNRLETEVLDEGQRKNLAEQIRYIDDRLVANKGQIESYRFKFETGPEPVLDRFIALRSEVGLQQNTVLTTESLFREKLPRSPEEHHITERAGELNLLSRAVASSKVDQLLGTNVLAQEKFGVDANGKTIGVSVQVNGVGVTGNLPGGKSYFLDAPFASHEVQKGLYDLEVMDYITGQLDRHAGNMFVDPDTGEVRGIDNDLAFPQMSREEMLEDSLEAKDKCVRNKPLFIHEDTAKKLESLKPEDLRRTLESVKLPGEGERGKLTPDEIEGAVTRLTELQQHVKELRKTGHVVKEFNKKTYDEAISSQEQAFQNFAAGNKPNTDPEQLALNRFTPSTDNGMLSTLDHAPKTSYLGSVAIERRKNELGIRHGNAERLDIEGVREATQTTGKIRRGPQQEEFVKLVAEKRGQLRSEVANQQEHLQEAGRLNQGVKACDDRLAKLQKPGFVDWLKSLKYGGPGKERAALNETRSELLSQQRDLDRRIDQKVNERLEGQKEELWNKALEKAPLENRLKQSDLHIQLKELELDVESVELRKSTKIERRASVGEVTGLGKNAANKPTGTEVELDKPQVVRSRSLTK